MIKRIRLWIRNIFGFSSSETNGFLILLPLMVLILLSHPIYQLLAPPPPLKFDEDQARIDSILSQWNFNPIIENTPFTLFDFDPNTTSIEDLKKLGFPHALANRLINYRNKGGKFRKAEDLQKIYGMDSALFAAIAPYIKILKAPDKIVQGKPPKSSDKKNLPPPTPFNLNTADTTLLKSIKGIGTVYARRIINYRDALGGYYSSGQIKEVYGLDSVIANTLIRRSFVAPDFMPRQLNINTVTEKDLYRHPYLTPKLARTIIAYRFQHGSFKEIDDLLKIELIDPEMLSRLRPYLTVDP